MFLVVLVCLFVRHQSNKWICIKRLPEVCLKPRDNQLNVWDDPDLQIIIWSQIKKMSNFHPLEVVGRGSEAQLQVAEN